MESRNQWLINLSKEDIWAEQLDTIPSMICHSYPQLRTMAENGRIYSVILQCKELYETLYKIPLIMAMIIIAENPVYKDKQGYSNNMRIKILIHGNIHL